MNYLDHRWKLENDHRKALELATKCEKYRDSEGAVYWLKIASELWLDVERAEVASRMKALAMQMQQGRSH